MLSCVRKNTIHIMTCRVGRCYDVLHRVDGCYGVLHRGDFTITGDKPPCTETVYAQYMVVPCPEYQHFPESEHAEFFQNPLNNVFAIFQHSKL